MELEFFPDGSTDCPLLIFSPSVKEEAKQFYLALNDMVADGESPLGIHTLPFISPIDDCKLFAQVSEQDIGVVPTNTLDVFLSDTKNHFEWKLKHKTWIFVLELLYPFTYKDSSGYQWLGESGQIQVVFSSYYRMW